MDKEQLIITALQQRIGEMAASYEIQIAILRAEITQMLDQKEEKEQAIQNYELSLDSLGD